MQILVVAVYFNILFSDQCTSCRLQQIKEEKFDALKTVKKKMQTDSNVKVNS